MKNALFIHGYNSDENSSTGARVKSVLETLGFSTTLKTFDVLNPFKTKKEIDEMLKHSMFNLIVGHSLGGFYTLVANTELKKIIINPSITPEKDLKRISNTEDHILKEFATLNAEKIKIASEQDKENVFALFGKHDELLSDDQRKPYVELFLKHYGNHYIILDCMHRPNEESLKIGLPLAIKKLFE